MPSISNSNKVFDQIRNPRFLIEILGISIEILGFSFETLVISKMWQPYSSIFVNRILPYLLFVAYNSPPMFFKVLSLQNFFDDSFSPPFSSFLFCISFRESPLLFALLVDVLRVDWVVKTIMYIPNFPRNVFTYLAIDWLFIGVYGYPHEKSSWGFPLNSCQVSYIPIFFEGVFMRILLSRKVLNSKWCWCCPSSFVFNNVPI